MKKVKRWIRTWLGITENISNPNRFVCLINYHNEIVGVDGNGDLYVLRHEYDGSLTVSLMMKNPLY